LHRRRARSGTGGQCRGKNQRRNTGRTEMTPAATSRGQKTSDSCRPSPDIGGSHDANRSGEDGGSIDEDRRRGIIRRAGTLRPQAEQGFPRVRVQIMCACPARRRHEAIDDTMAPSGARLFGERRWNQIGRDHPRKASTRFPARCQPAYRAYPSRS
jgi:hypothetical protein